MFRSMMVSPSYLSCFTLWSTRPEAVSLRSKVQKEMLMKEKERKEQELRDLAQKARAERNCTTAPPPSMVMSGAMDGMDTMEGGRLQREQIHEQRRRERRLDAAMGKKSKITRDRDRDISEKVALGMASAANVYNVYDKELFDSQSTLSTLYKVNKDVDFEMYGDANDEQVDTIMKTDRFKPDKVFTGTAKRAALRNRAVES
ncbi:SNW/SKI-interacting protein [Linum perenne]